MFLSKTVKRLLWSETSLPNALPQDVFVEAACEVALQQSVIVHSLGHHAPHKFEIAEMVGIAVRRRVDGVGDPVSGWRAEQSVHGVKHFSGDDHVPLSQQTTSILPLFPFKHNVPEGVQKERCEQERVQEVILHMGFGVCVFSRVMKHTGIIQLFAQ